MSNRELIARLYEKALRGMGAVGRADSVALSRSRRTLEHAIRDLKKYAPQTAEFGQMARIPIPKEYLSLEDLRRLGFRDSLVAVPEIGQKQWTSYRHPLHDVHIHDHGDLFNIHVDKYPSMAMQAERRSLPRKMITKLLETIPAGVKKELGARSSKYSPQINRLIDFSRGARHAIAEGVPGYINWAVKSLNPNTKPLVEEILSELPRNYLRNTYDYTRPKIK